MWFNHKNPYYYNLGPLGAAAAKQAYDSYFKKKKNGTIPYVPRSTALDLGFAASYTLTQQIRKQKRFNETNMNGNTYKRVRTAYGGHKRAKIQKLINSTIFPVEQILSVQSSTQSIQNVEDRMHPVSEYGLNGGYMGICTDSNSNSTPMHVYDLSYFIGNDADTMTKRQTTVPLGGSTQNDCPNARSWFWASNGKFRQLCGKSVTSYRMLKGGDAFADTSGTWPGAGGAEIPFGVTMKTHGWRFKDPKFTPITVEPDKVYRKSIDINFMVYGCKKMPTTYDIRVIRITNPQMCPDYPNGASNSTDFAKQFDNAWKRLVYGYTANPLLKAVEPGPPAVKPWFRTVAKKRITIGEQTSDIDRIQSIQGRIHVKLNEVNAYNWTLEGHNVTAGEAAYDEVPFTNADDQTGTDQMKKHPWWTSRYYLLIRALSTVDCASTATTAGDNGGQGTNVDGITNTTAVGWQGFADEGILETDYQPSYDLSISTKFAVMRPE